MKLAVKIRKICTNRGALKAIASVTIDEAYVVHGVKIIETDKGRFVAMPGEVQKDKDGKAINSELKTMLSSARSEYWVMVALVVGNIPLLYLLNKEWYQTLMHTTPGKIVLGICGIVILVTALFMMKFTKPINYKR